MFRKNHCYLQSGLNVLINIAPVNELRVSSKDFCLSGTLLKIARLADYTLSLRGATTTKQSPTKGGRSATAVARDDRWDTKRISLNHDSTNIHMKKIFMISIALILLGAGCSGQTPVVTNTASPASSPAQNSDTGVKTTQSITIQNFAFSPKTLTVKRGDAVVFKNGDSVTHTVTADGGAFDSGQMQSGSSFTLDTSTLAAGSYAFHCTPPHPAMTATLIVQ